MHVVRRVVPDRYAPLLFYYYCKLTSVFYTGGGFWCPCCGHRFRKMRTFGDDKRINSCCPRCVSLERHRLLWLYLVDKTPLFVERLKVLHFAPEISLQRAFRSMSNLDYVSADLESPQAMLKADITDIPYRDNSFDAIICNHVLEHVCDDQAAMSELFRVLRPGGWAILQAAVDPTLEETIEGASAINREDRRNILGSHDHLRIYGKDYADRLRASGFEVTVDSYVRKLNQEMVSRAALNTAEDIYFCTKTAAT